MKHSLSKFQLNYSAKSTTITLFFVEILLLIKNILKIHLFNYEFLIKIIVEIVTMHAY